MLLDCRRTFLTCALLMMACAPWALGHDAPETAEAPADARCVTDSVQTGSAAFTYRSVANWCQMPEGQKSLGSTHGGVVVDKAGNIYFSMEQGPHGILVYSPDGKLVRAIADKFTGIHGMCINEENGEEFIYGAHLTSKEAVKLKLDGTPVWKIGFDKINLSKKYEDAKQLKPTAVTVAANGHVYIADGYGESWIHEFDENQKYVRSFGGKGEGDGQFKTCHGISVDNRSGKPLLMVCDREHNRIQHLNMDGTFVAVIYKDPENRSRPCCVSIHGDTVAVADLTGRVLILDKDNKVVADLGDNPDPSLRAVKGVPPEKWKDGIFNAAHGVSFDKDANLYVEDWNQTGRISKLERVK